MATLQARGRVEREYVAECAANMAPGGDETLGSQVMETRRARQSAISPNDNEPELAAALPHRFSPKLSPGAGNAFRLMIDEARDEPRPVGQVYSFEN